MKIDYEHIKLKLCPFCGGNPIWGTSHSGMGNVSTYKYIYCPTCKISTDEVFVWNNTIDEIQPLINKWNKRTVKGA